jgi:hypothetical protein
MLAVRKAPRRRGKRADTTAEPEQIINRETHQSHERKPFAKPVGLTSLLLGNGVTPICYRAMG